MHPIIKVALTAAAVVTLAWPLLFWGKPAQPDNSRIEQAQPPPIYNTMMRNEIYW